MNFTSSKYLEKLNKGDEKAYLQAYDFFAPKIFRYVLNQTGKNKDTAEDLTQQTFFKTWIYIANSIKQIENISAFLFRTARNLIIDHWRQSQKQHLPLKEELVETTEIENKHRSAIEAKIDIELLERSLVELPTQYREVLIMRYLEDLDIDEIAVILNKDKNNIYVLIHRALNKLRKIIQNQYR